MKINNEALMDYVTELRNGLDASDKRIALLTDKNIADAIKSVVKVCEGFVSMNKALPAVSSALDGYKLVFGEEDTLAQWKVGHAFTAYLEHIGDLATRQDDFVNYNKENGTVFLKRPTRFALPTASNIHSILEEEDGLSAGSRTGLNTVQYADYDEITGETFGGDSIMLLRHRAYTEAIAPVTVKGVNAVQSQAYKRSKYSDAGATAYRLLLENIEKANAMGKQREYRENKKEDVSNYSVVPLDRLQIENAAVGCEFLHDQGKAYIQYGIDRRGRQYPVGLFNHFSNVVAPFVTPVRHELEDAVLGTCSTGVNQKRDYKARLALAKEFINGNYKALGAFYVEDTFEVPDDTKGVKAGTRTVARFDYGAFSAALALAA